MNKIKTLQFVLLFLCHFGFSQISNNRSTESITNADKMHYCATDKLNSDLINQNSSTKEKANKMNEQWQKWAIDRANQLQQNGLYKGSPNSVQTQSPQAQTLPVIFHQMVNGSFTPITSSLTKPQLQAALSVLNQIYAGTAVGSKAAAITTSISFCLAEVDALGASITSYTYNNPSTAALDNTNQGQITVLSNVVQGTGKFPPTKYINIYIVEDITSPVAGFAYMPPAHGSSFDGIYIEAQYLLPPTLPNDLAYNTTVLAHEMGHYLGLFHTFGICNPSGSPLALPSQTCSCYNNNCLFDGDMVCDTPPDFSITDVPVCTAVNTCTTDVAAISDPLFTLTSDVNDLINNYMDYGNWNCQNSFTQGQINRMHFMIDAQDGPRNSLLNSNACNAACASNCTTSINPITTTTINGVYYPNTLNLVSSSISYTFTGNLCNSNYNTINWSLIDLSTNIAIATGTSSSFPTTFTTTGNYRIILNTSASGTNPLCAQSKTLDIQVLPSANCPANLDMSNSWNTNWQRIQYEGGWPRTGNNANTFVQAGATFTVHPPSPTYPNGTNNNSPFMMMNTFNDPNFPSVTSLPPGITNIMRVGALITPTTTLNSGDAEYVTYTFTPTQSNSRIRVWYLGMKERDQFSQPVHAYDFSTGANSGGTRTSFGFVCNYDFISVSTGILAHKGLTHSGSLSNLFIRNDMITDEIHSPSFPSTLVIGTRTMDAMSGWQYQDLDFSEFACVNPTITITFFARSDAASNPGFHHSYAYFGATCLPSIYNDININLPNRDIACMANTGQSCTSYTLPAPNNYSWNDNWYNYNDLIDIDLEESYDGITYTVIPTLPAGSNITGISTPVLNLCKQPDNHPYKYYRVKYNTLCQTITNTLTISQGFVHSINDCAPNPMNGGTFISSPITIGTKTVSPDKYVQYCSTTTLSLNPPCWWHPGDPTPIYQWQSGAPFSNIAGANSASLVENNTFNACKPYRRLALFHDVFCNNDIWIPSDTFIVSSYKAVNFSYTTSGPDVCVNDPATVNINNFWESYALNNCDIELAAQTATTPVSNTITFTFYSNSTCIPSNSITASGGGSSVLIYPYNNTIPSSSALNVSFTFNNTMYTSNDFVYAVVEYNRYGCITTSTISIPIKVKASAIAGTIPSTICLNPNMMVTGSNPNPITGYYWQYSYSSTFSPTLSLGTSTVNSITFPSSTFTSYPVYLRMVSNGTNDCPNPAFSNSLTITNNSVNISVPSNTTICSGTTLSLTATGATNYTWSSPPTFTTNINPLVVTPTITSIYTVTGTNGGGCSDTKTISVTVNPTPTLNIVASPTAICVGSSATLTAAGAATYTWVNASPANNFSVVVSPVTSTIYTVTGANAFGCTSTKTVALTVNVGANFTVQANPTTICAGSCSTLSATGVNSYTWLPSASTGTSSIVCPTVTTTYSVLGFKTGQVCPMMKGITVTVLPSPTVNITGNTFICPTINSTTLTAVSTVTTGVTYSWSPTGLNGPTTNTYATNSLGVKTVTVTGSNGCITIKTATIIALPNSLYTVTPTAASVCLGSSYTFTGSTSPVTSYSWSPSGVTTNTASFTPTTTSIYTVTGTNAGKCPITKTLTLIVLPNPTVTITGPTSICEGASTTLTATGGGTYSWSPTGPATNTYVTNTGGVKTVTVTDANGCKSIASKTVTISPPSVPIITPSSSTICLGSCIKLNASNVTTQTWTPGGASTNSINVCPTSTSIYTLTGQKDNECPGITTATVYVVPIPTITVTGNALICNNTITLSATGALTYTWNPGAVTTSTLLVSTIGTYSVIGSNGGLCTRTKTVAVMPQVPCTPAKMLNSNTSITEALDYQLPFLYPNPTHESFNIMNAEEVIKISIYDYTGKFIKSVNKSENENFENIRIDYLSSGIYLIKTEHSNNKLDYFKLIKD